MKEDNFNANCSKTLEYADKTNYGIAILRIWMSFEIVLDHFGGDLARMLDKSVPWYIRNVYVYGNMAVPVFMILAFALTDISCMVSDNVKVKKRFYRLLVPHVFWSVCYFAVFQIFKILKGQPYLRIDDLKGLLWQLLLGHSINRSAWFTINLLIITLLFLAVFKIFKNKGILVVLAMGYLGLFLQYSGINGELFSNVAWPEGFDKGIIVFPVGRIAEMLPYAAVGVCLTHFNVLKVIRKNVYTSIPGILILLYFIFAFKPFSEMETTYGYAGLHQLMVGLLSVMLFYALPFEFLGRQFKRMIRFLSRYTMSVYFMHLLVGSIIYDTFLADYLGMRGGSIHDSFVIYICCLVLSFVLGLIPIKLIRDAIL